MNSMDANPNTVTHVELHLLHETHRLRNSKLIDIKAETRAKVSPIWRDCWHWRIAVHTFNELGKVWKELNLFRAPLFTVCNQPASITCHVCKRTSFHPKDIAHEYCGHCKCYHESLNHRPS